MSENHNQEANEYFEVQKLIEEAKPPTETSLGENKPLVGAEDDRDKMAWLADKYKENTMSEEEWQNKLANLLENFDEDVDKSIDEDGNDPWDDDEKTMSQEDIQDAGTEPLG